MSKKEMTLNDLFHDTLKDIYFAEKKILAALPKMAKAARSAELRTAFEEHRLQTEDHVQRLDEVFQMIDAKSQAKTCEAIIGIVKESEEVIKDLKDSPALDAGLLAAAQAVEHYEISRYGTLRTWAAQLGLLDAVPLLNQTLEEEKEADKRLTDIAVADINQEAA
jgi:ferritin-like metal-binding protein YciE